MSWFANGNTAPRWRSCDHHLIDGRCVRCRARWEVMPPQDHRARISGVPIGHPDIQPPDLRDTYLMGGAYALGKDGFMQSAKRGAALGNVASVAVRRERREAA